jgi:HEAT repeat protein
VGRANAIESVGEQRVNLAADEIIKALHDPQPRVRRQAASALARLNDPRAVGELIHQIEFHPDLIEDETVEALGELQSSEAVPVLVGLLQSPRSLVRRSAARALGDIGSPNAVQPLIAVASDPSDPDLRRAALHALRVIGAPEAESAISNALVDPLPSVRIAAAEAAQALGLSTSAPSLRRSLQTFADEACSEVAYTLGAVGDESDIPAILREAQRSVSIITRRRCLLGVARQLGVEQRAYRLLLLEGMSRDTALLEILRPALRRNRKLQVAVARFSSGDEPGALVALALAWKDPRASLLAQNPVPELFLIACAAMLEGQAR